MNFKDLLPFTDHSNIKDFFHCLDKSLDNEDTLAKQIIDHQAIKTARERLFELQRRDNR